ncbi:MAG: pyridoxal phosphate-dependent aminotransferase [Polyangia bacterium]
MSDSHERFSRRVPWHLPQNPLSQAVAARRRLGLPLLDLTVSNPTAALPELYEPSLLAPLADPRGLRYEPSPQGHPEAREAVAAYYRRRGLTVDPQHVVLSASTSEAYAWLFQLLCEPGERVLFPVPSYPLIELLAGVCGVQVDPYALYYDGRWRIDAAALERELTPTTRALVLVSPNNPTGSFLHRDELAPLLALCARRGVALIVDEVFGDYPLDALTAEGDAEAAGGDAAVPSLLELAAPEALVFVLSGLSKVVGLPQLKLGWIVIRGPEPLRTQAQDRLEILADTFLSVGTPVQLAAPSLLAQAERLRAAISLRTRHNLTALSAAVADTACQLLPVEGGWYAVLRLPRVLSEEEWALAFLEAGVLCQPGYFFDFAEEAFVVVSLLCRPEPFLLGVRRIVERVQAELDR